MAWRTVRIWRAGWLGAASALLLLSGCSKKPKPQVDQTTPSATAALSAATAPSSAGSAAPASSPVCLVKHEKVWSRWASRHTGLTLTDLGGGRMAFGLAVGTNPRVLVFSPLGTGELRQVPVKAGSELAKAIPGSQGVRHLQRVTPALDARGNVVAYADYRDKYQEKRRRIACVPAATDESKLLFDGTPLFKDGERLAAPSKEEGCGRGPQGEPQVLTELRDCRSFVDPGGKGLWGVGTELRCEPQDDGTHKWSMNFLIYPGDDRPPIKLRKLEFEEVPKKLYTLEAPVAQRLGSGSYLLTGCYRGALLAWMLDGAKQPQGSFKTYRGGHPGLPRILPDGSDFWFLTAQKAKKDYTPKVARIAGTAPKLPPALTKLSIAGHGPTQAEPTVAKAKGQRWISFHAGERRKGQLVVLPVDEKLQAAGAAFVVSGEDETVYESHLLGLQSGELIVVYIQNGAVGADLISKRLSCWVRK